MGELDLRLESSAAAEFAANTAKDEGFQVPEAASGSCPARTGDDAGLGRRASGWTTTPLIDAAGHDRTVLGARVLQLFLNHALRDGYFHADMHQGNLKIAAERRHHRL